MDAVLDVAKEEVKDKKNDLVHNIESGSQSRLFFEATAERQGHSCLIWLSVMIKWIPKTP